MGIFDWLGRIAPSAAEIRAEVWNLGVRHRGEPLQGALAELRSGEASPARAVLLRACVQQLRGGPRPRRGGPQQAAP